MVGKRIDLVGLHLVEVEGLASPDQNVEGDLDQLRKKSERSSIVYDLHEDQG